MQNLRIRPIGRQGSECGGAALPVCRFRQAGDDGIAVCDTDVVVFAGATPGGRVRHHLGGCAGGVTGIGSLLACGFGAVPLTCYSASCGALAEGLFSGGGLLVGGGCGRIVGPFGPVRSSRVQSIRKKKALEMLALTGDFEKSARMSGISGRTLRRCL